MKYLTFTSTENNQYPICFLVPQLHQGNIQRYYLDPFFPEDVFGDFLAYNLHKHPKKTKVAIQRAYLDELVPVLRDLSVRFLVVCDAEYFRTLSGGHGGEPNLGYVMDSCPEYAGFKIIYAPNHKQAFYDPQKFEKAVQIAMGSLKDYTSGTYTDPGSDILTYEAYPFDLKEIYQWLDDLKDKPLAMDIEGFSLKHYSAGVGTISLAWNQNEGIAFPVDLHPLFGKQIREALVTFFRYRAEHKVQTIWHNIAYDVYVLVYQLFMTGFRDTKGLLDGLSVLLANWDCTRLITYLATNSCAGNKLGLKFQAQEHAGNYAVDEIEDITQIPLKDLLRYNLIDSISTWYVYNKHRQTVIQDDQEEIYQTLFKPATVDIIQMQLTGLPLNMHEVKALHSEMGLYIENALGVVQGTTIADHYTHTVNLEWVHHKNTTLKKKRVTLADAKEVFNPNSDLQLRRILYEEQFMNLPVIDLTDSKLPSTGVKTLLKLRKRTTKEDYLEFLDAMILYSKAFKIYNDFLKKFLEAPQAEDGWHYLYGNFNLGGTVSGRLSSSKPNLQNLPSSTDLQDMPEGAVDWAKKVKKCFQAPPGKLFVGLDFDSLEDRISALLTKDRNKLKVYTDGYDGHSLRAYSYFAEQMEGIDPDSVESINSIAVAYEPLRQQSKTPTFLLTYGGTYIGIMEQLGWPKEKAQMVEARYHELYVESDEWVAARIQEASEVGYVTVAFGLRVRTPLLEQTILGNSKTPYEAEAEARTAGNALGQSWCMLNSRAGVEFMDKVRSSKFSLKIEPCAHIHDAQYLIIDDDIETLLFVNKHLVKAVSWQEHPAIQHDLVKLSGELSVFYPSWAEEMGIPTDATPEVIHENCLAHYEKYCN